MHILDLRKIVLIHFVFRKRRLVDSAVVDRGRVLAATALVLPDDGDLVSMVTDLFRNKIDC